MTDNTIQTALVKGGMFFYNVFMFIKSKAQLAAQKNEFINYIQKETGETVSFIEFAQFKGEHLAYTALGLETESWQTSVWGLLIFSDKEVFYYTRTQETYLERLMQRTFKNNQKEFLIKFSDFKDVKFLLPPTGFFSFLKPEKKRTIEVSFTDKSGNRIYFSIITNSNAFEIYQKLTTLQE